MYEGVEEERKTKQNLITTLLTIKFLLVLLYTVNTVYSNER